MMENGPLWLRLYKFRTNLRRGYLVRLRRVPCDLGLTQSASRCGRIKSRVHTEFCNKRFSAERARCIEFHQVRPGVRKCEEREWVACYPCVALASAIKQVLLLANDRTGRVQHADVQFWME